MLVKGGELHAKEDGRGSEMRNCERKRETANEGCGNRHLEYPRFIAERGSPRTLSKFHAINIISKQGRPNPHIPSGINDITSSDCLFSS